MASALAEKNRQIERAKGDAISTKPETDNAGSTRSFDDTYINELLVAARQVGTALAKLHYIPEVTIHPARPAWKDPGWVAMRRVIATGWPIRESYLSAQPARFEMDGDYYRRYVSPQKASFEQLLVSPDGELIHCGGKPLGELYKLYARNMNIGQIGLWRPWAKVVNPEYITAAGDYSPNALVSYPRTGLLKELAMLAVDHGLQAEQLDMQQSDPTPLAAVYRGRCPVIPNQ